MALGVPDLDEPYFAELTAQIVRTAAAQGVSTLIVQTDGIRGRELALANGVGLPPVDGQLLVPRSLTVADLTRRTTPGPLVLLGEHLAASPFAHVTIDNRAAARAAVEHLVDVGCRRIAVIGPRIPSASDAATQRFAGYCDVVADNDLAASSDLIGPVTAFSAEEGYRAMSEMLDRTSPPDGVFCANDSLAFGVLRRLHERGLRIPDDVSVIGVDDLRAAGHSWPPLSSVAVDREALVANALGILTAQLESPPILDTPVEQVTIGFEVVARASTAREVIASSLSGPSEMNL